MIRVRGLHKYYEGHHLFNGINLDVEKGEVVVFIGPSGSGKSTFLRCINGLEYFQKGEIIVDGIELHSINRLRPDKKDFENIRQVRLKAGMVFQQFNLFPHMTVMENIIEAPVRVLGSERGAAIENARLLLSRINIGRKADSYPEELSGGEQQRVALARAFSTRPKVLFADEPTGNLDARTGAGIIDLMVELNRDLGTTLVLVTHDLELAGRARRTIRLADGRVAADSAA